MKANFLSTLTSAKHLANTTLAKFRLLLIFQEVCHFSTFGAFSETTKVIEEEQEEEDETPCCKCLKSEQPEWVRQGCGNTLPDIQMPSSLRTSKKFQFTCPRTRTF